MRHLFCCKSKVNICTDHCQWHVCVLCKNCCALEEGDTFRVGAPEAEVWGAPRRCERVASQREQRAKDASRLVTLLAVVVSPFGPLEVSESTICAGAHTTMADISAYTFTTGRKKNGDYLRWDSRDTEPLTEEDLKQALDCSLFLTERVSKQEALAAARAFGEEAGLEGYGFVLASAEVFMGDEQGTAFRGVRITRRPVLGSASVAAKGLLARIQKAE